MSAGSRAPYDLLDRADATACADAVREGAVSASELVDAAIDRVTERNPALNAVVGTRFDEARAEAATVDPDSQPFAGVPFVIKDLGAAITGLPHTRGSRLWADDVATEDTELVARYRRLGFVVLGTTNAPELGKNASTEPVLHGPCHNPHDLDRSPGGSSGGTAAAVAAGMVPIGHGNDGGGSIRIPASACGLVGLKPSRARVTAAPEKSLLSYPMGCNHVLTRSVRDTARVLDLTAGPMPGDPFVIPPPTRPWVDELGGDPGPLTIGISTVDRAGDPVDPACAAAVEAAGRTLEALGHRVVPGQPAFSEETMTEIIVTLMGVPLAIEVNKRLAELGRPLAEDDLEPFSHVMYGMAADIDGERVLVAMQLVEEI
ncbi:MAG: amidase family protein, partial [Actinomycetota bacterium]